MENKISKALQVQKKSLKFYYLILGIGVCISLASNLLLKNITLSDNSLYITQLLSVLTLFIIPVAIIFFNKAIKKVNTDNIDEWCDKYFGAVMQRSSMIITLFYFNIFIYTLYNYDSALYLAIIGLIAYLYVYPSKREVESLIKGDTIK